ncbi:hypothetical protein KFE25_004077 [Diacronema lutheri]|uniref:JmjC domain-containing protein n=2 Tax=Diacronema lutheri TaxID=2081491 RepID=A0A8J5XNK2_DIALT|nr:hypothetical protein KFE25_004077 [Diacronema lutheri]
MAGHPHGVLPEGQRLVDGHGRNLRDGLGPLLGALTDELLVRTLALLEPRELGALARVCRALHVFAHADDLWKPHVLEAVGGAFAYEHSWRSTYVCVVLRRPAPGAAAAARSRHWASLGSALYSDLLFAPWRCATQPPPDWWLRTPAGCTTIERVDGAVLTPERFATEYDVPGRPVVLAGLASGWPAVRSWACAQLLGRFGERSFAVGEMQMRLCDFVTYVQRSTDDPPLYLFDKNFGASAPELCAEYDQSPRPFPADLLALLGTHRPDWRWLIIGGARSGSTWHVDPNRTSAWNACVCGSKAWLLTPPHAPPPGVSASADGATIACPVSVVEWMSGYLAQARRELGTNLHEAHVGAGDVLFVPRGWWHCVLNLEAGTVAVTHNFASEANLAEVLAYADPADTARGCAEDLVSGVPRAERAALRGRLIRALREHRPDALVRATRPEAVAAARLAIDAGLGRTRRSPAARPHTASLWAQLTRADGCSRVGSTSSASACGASVGAEPACARGVEAASRSAPGGEPTTTFQFHFM